MACSLRPTDPTISHLKAPMFVANLFSAQDHERVLKMGSALSNKLESFQPLSVS